MSLEQRVTNSDSLLNDKRAGILVGGGTDFTVASLQAYLNTKIEQPGNNKTVKEIIVEFANEQYNNLIKSCCIKGKDTEIIPNNNNIIKIINTLEKHYEQIVTRKSKYKNIISIQNQIKIYKEQFDSKVNELLISYHMGIHTITSDISSRLNKLCTEIKSIDCSTNFGMYLSI